VAGSKLDGHVEAFVLGEEALLGGERLPADPDLERRTNSDVAHPVRTLPQTEQMTASLVARS
jgi:hypothetical protein